MMLSKDVVVVCPESPYPAITGGRLVLFNRIQCLIDNGFNVHLFCAAKGDDIEMAACYYKKQVESIKLYNRDNTKAQSIAKYCFGEPFTVANRFFPEMREDLDNLLWSKGKLGFAVVEFPQMLSNISERFASSVPVIVEQHNCEWMTAKSLSSTSNGLVERLVRKGEAGRLRHFEASVYREKRIAGMLFLTEADMKLVSSNVDCNTKLFVSKPGGDSFFSNKKESIDNTIVFIANYAYGPNESGALWFLQEVLPLLRANHTVKFLLVGKDPSDRLLKEASVQSDVRVTGTVDDLRKYYEAADILIAPIFNGGGIKMKVIEAMSSNRPLVCTGFAAEGIGINAGEDAMVADTPEAFAAAIDSLLSNADLRGKISANARIKFEKEWSWETSNEKWLKAIIDVAVRKA